MLKLAKIFPGLVLFLPAIAQAQVASPNASGVNTTLNNLISNARTVITLLFIFATLVFLWGLITYIAKGDDDAAKKKAKGLMTWGIIGLAVMASAWGLTRYLTSYFGVQKGSIPTYQTVQ